MPGPPADITGPDSSPGPAGSSSGPAIVSGPPAGHWPAFNREELKRAHSGDGEALGRFFDHYFDRIFSVVHRFVGSVDAAQDITQDIFLKVRRHISRLDIEKDPAPWLYTVTVNACRDYRRSAWWRMSRQSVPLDHDPDTPELSSNATNPEQALVVAEEERRLQAAIRRLPPDLRLSVLLHDFEGLSHEHIARITGTSHAAARKRHSRALRALADLLGEGATP
ncbi:MAG: sigma-70 family RNA polymerase sigma factor [Candidatus Eisenbacteria bacterium]|uniref:Sigma-70 family RNA polymerase sigma factor n=1 Tax=Eiseniibacteriota bacterium TaxID=2212470 RepID=A0A538TLX2_UNCEI|nr:MAG: sigma-70 family RNA polymerase sigma factor [Candidatus Eisenbacteria bacterium]